VFLIKDRNEDKMNGKILNEINETACSWEGGKGDD